MSRNEDQNLECPLCMEPFEMDDFTFFPCTCGYQICRFCWHRIRTDENGLCPACRKQYPEDPADFKPLSAEEIQKIKSEKRQKDQRRKHKAFENRRHLADVRVVQKNLVFVVGLPPRLADPEILKKHHYFGKFGRIQKVVVNHTTTYAGSQGPSASAYVTYCRPEDALSAIKTVNQIQIDGRILKASLGTTKYCSYFLKNQQCPKADCMYLHEFGDEAASFTKDDMKKGKHQEYERHLQDIYQISNNKKDTASPRPQKKFHSYKDTWPSAPQNPKAAQAKESKTDKQNRSKYKYVRSDSPRRKTKGKSEENPTSLSSNKSSKKEEEDTSFPKRSPRPPCLNLKDCVITNQVAVKRTERLPPFRNTVSSDKQLAVNEMNNRNVQKTLLHIGGQSVHNQSVKCTEKSAGDCPSFPSSPTSSSSSSLFTPFGSFSSNFLSSSPSPPLHSGDHLSFSAEDSSQHGESHDSSTNVSPQNFVDTVTESPLCVTLNCADSDIKVDQLETLSITPPSSSFSFCGLTSEDVMPKNEQEINMDICLSSASKMQKQDDDLDFDPWEESNKGLGDLIAKETTFQLSSATSIPPGFSYGSYIPSRVPNSRITPPPGFIPLIPPARSDYPLANKTLLSGLPEDYFPLDPEDLLPLPSNVIEIEEGNMMHSSFRGIYPNVNVTYGGTPTRPTSRFSGNLLSGDSNWQPPETAAPLPGNITGPVWKKTIHHAEDPNRIIGSSYSSLRALRGPWPSSSSQSQFPPPGFVVVPPRSPEPHYQHVAVTQNETKCDDGHIG